MKLNNFQKSIILLLVSIMIISSLLLVPKAKETPIDQLMVEYINVSMSKEKGQAYISGDGKIMVPLKPIADKLNNIKWDDSKDILTINGVKKELGKGVVKKGKITYVPLKTISTVLGQEVDSVKVGKKNIVGINSSLDIYKNLSDRDVVVKVNGKTINVKPKVYLDRNQRLMVPLRFISETLGYEVKWDGSTKTVTIDNNIKVKIGSKDIVANGNTIKMDTEPTLIEGTTYVPARFISEALGESIEYKRLPNMHLIEITSKNVSPDPGEDEGPVEPADPNDDGSILQPIRPYKNTGTHSKPAIYVEGSFDKSLNVKPTIELISGGIPKDVEAPVFVFRYDQPSGGYSVLLTTDNERPEMKAKNKFIGNQTRFNKVYSLLDNTTIDRDSHYYGVNTNGTNLIFAISKYKMGYFYNPETKERVKLIGENEDLTTELVLTGNHNNKEFKATYKLTLPTPGYVDTTPID